MVEEPEKKCDPDDIICQADLLAKMKYLRSAFDDEDFKKKYPSLVELSPRLDEAIKSGGEELRKRLTVCNLTEDILEKKTEEKPPEEE